MDNNFDLFEAEALRAFFADNGFQAFELCYMPDNTLKLDSEDINTFISFLNANAIKTVFYSYSFLNEDRFNIDSGIGSKLKQLASVEIEEYASSLKQIDFDKPALLDLCCAYNGIVVQLRLASHCVDSIPSISELCDELERKYSDELQHIYDAEKESLDALRNELRDALLADEEFLSCTTKSMRRRFMRTYFVKNGKYLRAFMMANGKIDDQQIPIFADKVYAIYRESKRK